jgi:Ca2+-transporting ATPase
MEEAVRILKTDPVAGLTTDEAVRRITEFGANKLEEKKNTPFIVKFLRQFKDFMIIVLILAAIISGVIGVIEGEGVVDSIIILIIVVINSFIGAIQESRAEKSLDALKKMSAHAAHVVRNGITEVLPSELLVPGDLVEIETGDFLPADLRIVESINLKAQESALTGESEAVEKFADVVVAADAGAGDRINMLFSSSIITYGRGKGIVAETAMRTEVGKIARIINETVNSDTPLQKKLNSLGKSLGLGVLGICVVIFAIGLIRSGFAPEKITELFLSAVSLAVAAIPEGLPAVATIVLSFGVVRMVKKNAIVKNLPSVETLGSTTVICSDKTGTLTQNKMTVEKIYLNCVTATVEEATDATGLDLLVHAAVLCNDSRLAEDGKTLTGDPTETALVDMGLRLNINKNELNKIRVDELPFDSVRKLMTTVHEHGSGYIVYTKGAADELVKKCDHILMAGKIFPITEEEIEAIRAANHGMAAGALRILGMAYKELTAKPTKDEMKNIETGLIFIGMVGMMDPPRPECRTAVAKCRRAGIKPVMITGDHKITAIAIARDLGILENESESLTGGELEVMDDAALIANVRNYSVYARVSPEHKVRIVKAWRANNEVVAMTGDGVNDAPALKNADIGIAMGITGTDVAKQAADVILTDDNFATIVTSVEEGRRIYANILKAVQFLLSSNIGEVIVLFIASLLGWLPPLLPIQILWVNLVTDSLPALALAFEHADSHIMQIKPVRSNNILTKKLLIDIVYQGVMIGVLTLAAFLLGLKVSVEVAETMAFSVLAFSELVHVFNVRVKKSMFARGVKVNPRLLLAVGVSALLMLVVLTVPGLEIVFKVVPLPMASFLEVAALSLAPIPIVEIVKFVRRRLNHGIIS